mmetsp:Transcript_36595/g.40759  ORF Transcript_36595/g.40759 Transcript_36595/m.40759 type:complete len:103 (-) Transcript_36595:30-338(-)
MALFFPSCALFVTPAPAHFLNLWRTKKQKRDTTAELSKEADAMQYRGVVVVVVVVAVDMSSNRSHHHQCHFPVISLLTDPKREQQIAVEEVPIIAGAIKENS